MTPNRTHRFVAFAFSVVMTLTVFSGVASLASPDHAGLWYAQSAAATARG